VKKTYMWGLGGVLLGWALAKGMLTGVGGKVGL
jgi:hypothetical protein